MFPLPLFFGSKVSADGRGLWHNFLGYCRVTRSLPKFFYLLYGVLNKMKSNLGGLFCTRGSPQPKDWYKRWTQGHNTKHEDLLSDVWGWWTGVVVSALASINEVNQRRARLVGWPCPGSIPGASHLFRYVTNQPPKAKSAYHPRGSVNE